MAKEDEEGPSKGGVSSATPPLKVAAPEKKAHPPPPLPPRKTTTLDEGNGVEELAGGVGGTKQRLSQDCEKTKKSMK